MIQQLPRWISFCVALSVCITTVHSGGPPDSLEKDAKSGSKPEQTGSAGSPFEVKKTPNLRFCRYSTDESSSAGYCDVYLPQETIDSHQDTENPKPVRTPVILVVHGGGWMAGNKWTMERHARELDKRGFAAVSINYRLAPDSKFPDQVDDVRSALVWIANNAETYSFDLDRVGLYGYSAGGHLVSLVATLADEPWEEVSRTTSWSEDDQRWATIPSVKAVCIGGPPTDFRYLPPDNTALAFFLGGSRRELPDVYAAASPICFTSPKDPPFQIIHGEADGIVPISNAKEFHLALIKANVDASLHTLPGKGHLFAFISPQLTDWMLGFFEDQLLDERIDQLKPLSEP